MYEFGWYNLGMDAWVNHEMDAWVNLNQGWEFQPKWSENSGRFKYSFMLIERIMKRLLTVEQMLNLVCISLKVESAWIKHVRCLGTH